MPGSEQFINVKAQIKVGDGTLFKFSNSELKYFKDFLEKNNCEEDSDDEENETRKVTLPNDTIPYLEDLGILKEILKKEFTREEFDEFLRTRNVTIPTGLNFYVRDYFKYFLLTKMSEDEYLELYENKNIPSFKMKYNNINDNVIEYYRNLYFYLEENNLREDFIRYVKLEIELEDEFKELLRIVNGGDGVIKLKDSSWRDSFTYLSNKEDIFKQFLDKICNRKGLKYVIESVYSFDNRNSRYLIRICKDCNLNVNAIYRDYEYEYDDFVHDSDDSDDSDDEFS